jgi:hypothetical protein
MFNSHVISTPLEAGHGLSRDDYPHSPDEQEKWPLYLMPKQWVA